MSANQTVKATVRGSTHVNMSRVCPGNKERKKEREFRLDSNDLSFICAGNVRGNKSNA